MNIMCSITSKSYMNSSLWKLSTFILVVCVCGGGKYMHHSAHVKGRGQFEAMVHSFHQWRPRSLKLRLKDMEARKIWDIWLTLDNYLQTSTLHSLKRKHVSLTINLSELLLYNMQFPRFHIILLIVMKKS